MRAMAAAAVLLFCAAASHAGVLETVRHDGVLYCGAEPRAGVAEDRGDGTLGGVAVDLCRAVAAAVLGPRGQIRFRLYQSPSDFDAVRDGRDDLSFLTPIAIADQGLAPHVTLGPAVFTVGLSLLVPSDAPAQWPQALAGQPICFMIASDAQQALDASFRRWHRDFLHMAYEEEDEMADAFAARRCVAVAGEASELQRLTEDAGAKHHFRVLAPPLASFAVVAATPRGDAAWSRLAASLEQPGP
jgi:general L-amino acid transport system substrate-binding protein